MRGLYYLDGVYIPTKSDNLGSINSMIRDDGLKRLVFQALFYLQL